MPILRLVVVTLLAGLLLTATGSLAHAADPYPVTTPTPTPAVAPDDAGTAPDADRADRADDNGVLPGTGGASVYLLLVAGALLVVGGALVRSSRRAVAY